MSTTSLDSTTTATPAVSTGPFGGRFQRNVLLLAGGLGLAGLGVAAAGMTWGESAQEKPGSVQTEKASVAANGSLLTSSTKANKAGTPVPQAKHAASSVHAAAACAHCGVVESVQAVTVKGKGSGVGAVAGGAVGAVVGNQFGHGNGRAAMTVLGAVGGGLAGNEIEKRSKAETYYDVRVRMDDGTVRTIRQKSAPAKGSRVTVDNGVVRAATHRA